MSARTTERCVRPPAARPPTGNKPKPEPKILFQTYFKSVGPRTYAAQVKQAGNGNHFLVLTEGKRDPKTGEVRKTSLFVFSEDFVAFFRMLKESAGFIKTHPLPEPVRRKRESFWKRRAEGAPAVAGDSAPRPDRRPQGPRARTAPAGRTRQTVARRG